MRVWQLLVTMVVLGAAVAAPVSVALGSENIVELWQSQPADYIPGPVAVNSTDGSCWFGDSTHGQLVHLSAAGTELWRSSVGQFTNPAYVAVNSTDGSVWLVDSGPELRGAPFLGRRRSCGSPRPIPISGTWSRFR